MRDKAISTGMLFQKPVEVPRDADVTAEVRDSYGEWLWRGYKFVSWCRNYRPIFVWQTNDEHLIEYVNQTIDRTVFDRILQDPSYRPQNLKKCLIRLCVSTNLPLEDGSIDKDLIVQCLRVWDLQKNDLGRPISSTV
jgi:hypothetical protein